MPTTRRFGELAPILAENGYEPLPVHFGRKNPSAGLEWQKYHFVPGDEARYANEGTGLLCGKIIGLDIDVRDEAVASMIDSMAEDTFGPAPRRIGQPPKILRMLQADKPFTKLATRGYRFDGDAPEAKSHRVEILAQGQQFVAFNIHPDTGEPYVWNGIGDPLTVPIGLLPSISEAQARAFIARCDERLAMFGKPVGKLADADDRRPHETNAEQQAKDVATFRLALHAIPNDDIEFDDWIRVLYAVKGALGDNGLQDFKRWSAKAKNKDEPEFTTREYLAARPTKIGAATVYFLAAQFGWKRPQASAEEWPDPVNLFAQFEAPGFDGTELPKELADYPLLFSAQTGIDPTITLGAALVCAASAISDEIQVCGASSSHWFAQPRLWLLAIGSPGCGKTPGQREMLAPLWKMHGELDADWRAQVKTLGDDDPKPPRPRVILGDATLEALSDVLVDCPRGVLIATDEFDAWLGAMDQYKNAQGGRDRGEWLRLFDGGPHSIERVKRGSVFVKNWGVSILTATTPAAMQRLSRNLPEDGLIQRFIITTAKRQRIVTDTTERPEIEAAHARYCLTIRKLWGIEPRAHKGIVPLSFDAAARLSAWREENIKFQEALGSLDSALEAHIAKYPTLLLRLALTFHCAHVVSFRDDEISDPASFPISLATLETAIAFLRRAAQHATALYLGRQGGGAAFEVARHTARYILTVRDSIVQRRDLLRHVVAYRKAQEWEQSGAHRLLEDFGWIKTAEGGYSKQIATRLAINPKLSQKFAQLAVQERERRQLVREAIVSTPKALREPGEDDEKS